MSGSRARRPSKDTQTPRNPSRWTIFAAAGCVILTCCSGGKLWSHQAAAAPETTLSAEIENVGALPFSAELRIKLQAAWAARPADYKPRTKHLNADGSPKYTNRLFLESSPYLRQHAHNPVNWHPWGDEAFAEAKRLGRPVLLSVGYSTCHWCHVMEEESFEDEEIARFLNAHYVAIKVDREERPDIDAIYMAAVQALTGGGGWPMTVWLTAGREPYYGATYIPARDGDRGATNGFLTILEKLADVYRTKRGEVDRNVAALVEKVNQSLAPPAGGELPEAEALRGTASFYDRQYDSVDGGTKGAPKFPSNLSIRFLLRYHRRTGEAKYLEMAAQTLEKMARGGLYDQVGGGFHRYSTDAQWLVPHFEKMLYDNALLAVAYLEAYQATGREEFAATAREILRYVERDMTSPEGAFYSATDADSPNPEGEREEGWYFTWTPAELEAVLGKERARIVAAYYGVTQKGNFEGRGILHRVKTVEQALAELKLSTEQIQALIKTPSRSTDSAAAAFRRLVQRCNDELYLARLKRPAPLRDEKILTSWNGLMISAHAFAALVLNEPEFARRAGRAALFLLENSRRDGRLLRSYKDGQARHNAYLDDYAFLIAGLIDLYEATGDPRSLREAIALDRVLEAQYEDPENGGFFLTSNDHEELLAREKPSYDGAEPSGNSVAVLNLLRLHEFTTNDRYRQRAERAMKALSPLLRRAPWAMTEMLLALDFHLDTPKEILIVLPEGGSRTDARPFLEKIARAFVPNRVIAVVRQGDELTRHAALVPLLEDKRAIRGKTTAYVCEQRVCELPTGDSEVFARQIGKTRPLPSAEAQ